MLGAIACSGSISCGSCAGGPIDPIPGGFDPAAQIERGAQLRVTNAGFTFIEGAFQDLMSAFVSMECGASGDIPCPTDFVTVPGGMANPSTCDLTEGACVEQVGGEPGPLVGFEIEQTVQSNATICRDDLSDPARRPCYAYLRFEALQLTPAAPDAVNAVITTQIYSTEIPFYYDGLGGMDCLVRIDSGANGTPLQDLTLTAHLTEWAAPSGNGGRQLKVTVDTLDAMIPDDDVEIQRDPIHGDAFDSLLCGIANLGVVKNALIPQLTGSLQDVVGEEIDKALGMRCTGPDAFTCPAQTSCDLADGFCKEDATDAIVPTVLGLEGRIDFSSLLGGLTAGRPGQGDISFLVGGRSSGDPSGLSVGMLGGAEVVTPDPFCATILPSPRLRPGWVAPPALPNRETADLDFDGVADEPFMLAAGVSQALLAQYLWTIYTTGLFCQTLSGYDIDQLNTGTLALLIPSLNLLSHADKYPTAVFPARISIFPRAEPQITLGSGKTVMVGPDRILEEPLIDLFLDDLEISFQALIEDRWVHLMTLTQDVHLSLGAVATPQNEIELVIGDLSDSITDIRVTKNELLAEDPTDLEDTIPALISLALPQLTGALPPFQLPNGADLGGFELNILGIRGVEGATPGTYPNLAIYADLGFDPALVPNLSFAADTYARVLRLDVPSAEELAVSAEGGMKSPVVELELGGLAPADKSTEIQIRVDNSLWSPFFKPANGRLSLKRAELLVQGRHRIEVRARVEGLYRTLDPSPAVLDVVMDSEAPRINARLAGRDGGIVAHVYDVVSRDRVKIEASVDGVYRTISPNSEGFVALAEVNDTETGISVRATDEQGLVREVVLRASKKLQHEEAQLDSDSNEHASCKCTARAGDPSIFALLLIPFAFLAFRSRSPKTP
jgi:hypothetical protein